MKNKLKFVSFLISRFKGETIEIIGLGILFFLIVQLFVVHQLDQFTYSVDKYLSIVSFVFIMVGLSIRHYFKKSETKQTPS
jgi:predicted tellurium resistance membrane protein TerC